MTYLGRMLHRGSTSAAKTGEQTQVEGRPSHVPGSFSCMDDVADIIALSDDELTSYYDRQVAAVRHAQHAMLCAAAEIERRHMWKGDGAASLGDWIAFRNGEGTQLARQHAIVATKLPDRPLLADAFRHGTFGFEHLRYLLTLAELTDTDEATLVDYGQTYAVPQLRAACQAARRVQRHSAESAYRRRHIKWWFTDDGFCHIKGQLDAAAGLIVTQALTAMAEPRRETGESAEGSQPAAADEDGASSNLGENRRPPDDGTSPDTGATGSTPEDAPGEWIPFEARCADALTELCATRVADSPSERATVVIHTTVDDLVDGGNGTSWGDVVVGNDTPASLLRRPHSPHHPRRRRNGRRGRPDDPGDSLLAAGRASLSRQPMPVPPLPAHPVAPRPPHPTLGRWRTHRPGQLGTSVPTPPPPAPRGPMACRRQPERDPHLSRIRRAPLQQRTRHPTRRRPRYSGPAGPAGPAAERTGSDAPEDDRGSGPAIQPGHRRDVVVGPGAGRVEISLADRGCHRQLGRRRSRQ